MNRRPSKEEALSARARSWQASPDEPLAARRPLPIGRFTRNPRRPKQWTETAVRMGCTATPVSAIVVTIVVLDLHLKRRVPRRGQLGYRVYRNDRHPAFLGRKSLPPPLNASELQPPWKPDANVAFNSMMLFSLYFTSNCRQDAFLGRRWNNVGLGAWSRHLGVVRLHLLLASEAPVTVVVVVHDLSFELFLDGIENGEG
jgi:hypothetical protein